jgi:thioredoxin 1
MASVAFLSDSDFAEKISIEKPVLVDFWAPWCGPCQMLGPILETVATELELEVSVFKMNIDENPKTPSQFGVRSIPTLMLFQRGTVVATLTGVRSHVELIAWVRQHCPAAA